MAVAYLGLGGNLGDPIDTINMAVAALSLSDVITVSAVSRFYRTKPVGGPTGQPDYINAVVAVQCSVEPSFLLAECLSIERNLGRVRSERWGPRTIDIDILLYDDLVVEKPELRIPHPLLRKRLFALLPLVDVAPPELAIPPDGTPLRDLIASTNTEAFIATQQPLEILESRLLVPDDNSDKA